MPRLECAGNNRKEHTFIAVPSSDSATPQGECDGVLLQEKVSKYAALYGDNSWWAASVALVKFTVGPAALYLPHAFAAAGAIGGLLSMILVYLLTFCGIWKILRAWKRTYAPQSSYKGLMLETYGHGDVTTRRAGVITARLLELCCLGMQIATCITYFIFVSTTIDDVLRSLGAGTLISKHGIIVIMAICELPFTFIHRLEGLTAINAIATALIFFSLVAVVVVSVTHLREFGVHEDVTSFQPSTLYLFIGSALFALEGMAILVVPVAHTVKPQHQKYSVTMISVTVFGIAGFYTIYPLIVYLAYGPTVQVILLLSMPDTRLWLIVRALYAVAVFLTFPIQLFPVVAGFNDDPVPRWSQRAGSISGSIASDGPRSCYTLSDEQPLPHQAAAEAAAPEDEQKSRSVRGGIFRPSNFKRASVVIAMALTALIFDHALDHIVALMGALCSAPLVMIFPAILSRLNHRAEYSSLSSSSLSSSSPANAYRISASDIGDTLLFSAGVLVTGATTAMVVMTWKSAST